jgi:glycosyltransferase involved in cell wall biosynthesis
MKFWIVTPSYNQLDWLKLCVASVADQATEGKAHGAERIEVHHHIQDACSTDGAVDWLRQYEWEVGSGKWEEKYPGYSFSFASEADNGMYDAINKGWKLAPDDVDVIAHLNCDEQYLPGALKIIAGFMTAHPKADVVLADMIVVDKNGEYICHRRSLKPYRLISRLSCAGFTAATFQRVSVVKEKGVFFDTSWKNIGDVIWYNTLHAAGVRFAVSNQLVSVFTDTGQNLNWTDGGWEERNRYAGRLFFGVRVCIYFVLKLNAVRRVLKDTLLEAPTEYSIYITNQRYRRVLTIDRPRCLWGKKVS